MTRFAAPVTSFATADAFLGEKDWRSIGHNTAIRRVNSTTIAARYHYTDVVTYHEDGRVAFSTGGWMTSTTKVRLNALSACTIYSVDGVWEIIAPYGADGAVFEDGVVLDAEGTFQNWKEARALLRASRARRLEIKDAELAAMTGDSA